MKPILEYLLSKSDPKLVMNHEIVTFEKVYNYNSKCQYEIPMNELYSLLIKDAKDDYSGAKEYEKYVTSLNNVSNDELTKDGCILLGIRCNIEGHDKTYDTNKGPDAWWKIVKETSELIYEIIENFWTDNVKIMKQGSKAYPQYYIIFPDNEVMGTFCYNLKGLNLYKVNR